MTCSCSNISSRMRKRAITDSDGPTAINTV
ncbi:hypothetical protein LSH36_456g03015 [Paralvinella palmiformis]|uniref:Uncharacterized protein n=1 Tax=Paralvinella palmiformis TaxID=53620 RepID=A0AAD9JAQ5_9ANNE|nr:hypothetical protein LSH36_456g03015 [Paralvinella palmiformis]